MGQKECSKVGDEMLDRQKEFEKFWEYDPQYTSGDMIDRDVMKRRCGYVWRVAWEKGIESLMVEIDTLREKVNKFQYGYESE